jgi:aliphatic nitrilase
MGAGWNTLRAAAVQAAPAFLDRAATVERAVDLIGQAAAGGARLIAFGEGFLPGHPVWFHLLPVTHPTSIALSTALAEQAIAIPGPEVDALAEAAARADAVVVLGVVERPDPAASILHDTALVLGPDGLIGSRRKIVPAVGERIIFTAGSGEDIRVFPTPWGPLSVLLGGENANPLLTAAMRGMGARLHVAAWPPHFNRPALMPELMTITGRAVAYQNTAWVLSVAGATSPAAVERLATAPAHRELLEATMRDAASSVFAPRGGVHAGPQPGGDGMLFADLDLSAGTWANLVNRHYDRPDLLRLIVDRSPRPTPLTVIGGADGDAIANEIAERFGSRLSATEIAELVPYVRGVRDTGARLAALADDARDGSLLAQDDRGLDP